MYDNNKDLYSKACVVAAVAGRLTCGSAADS